MKTLSILLVLVATPLISAAGDIFVYDNLDNLIGEYVEGVSGVRGIFAYNEELSSFIEVSYASDRTECSLNQNIYPLYESENCTGQIYIDGESYYDLFDPYIFKKGDKYYVTTNTYTSQQTVTSGFDPETSLCTNISPIVWESATLVQNISPELPFPVPLQCPIHMAYEDEEAKTRTIVVPLGN